MVINSVHTTNYNYEFDLVQADRHRAAMATHFGAADLCKQFSADKLSSAEVSSAAIAQLGNFDLRLCPGGETQTVMVIREETGAARVATSRRRFLEP
jgi:hypothetical protein